MPLILSRRVGESIQIGDSVSVAVSSIAGNCVRLAITAPRHLQIWRPDDAPTRQNGNQNGNQNENQDENQDAGTSTAV